MKEVLEFLVLLRNNNNKVWFDTNRQHYAAIAQQFNHLAEQLINGIALFDPSVRGVTLRESTYRIYRDLRFSPNKEPYKSHIGLYVCPGGKKSGNAGYYFHLEPDHSLLAVGLHCPEPKVVRSVREDIFSLTDQFCASMKSARGFEIDRSSALKRTPREYPALCPAADYLRLREFDLVCSLSNRQVESADLLNEVLGAFESAKPFNDFLNRAVTFSRESKNVID